MSSEVILSFAAAATSLLGVFVTVLVSALSRPRSRLTIAIDESPLVAMDSPSIVLEHAGQRISQPRLLEIAIRNAGRRPVSSADFQRGEPLRILLGAPVVALLDISSKGHHAVRASSESVEVGPTLILPGQQINLTVLTDGTPAPLIRGNLTNVTIDRSPASTGDLALAKRQLFERFSFLMSVVGLGAAAAAVYYWLSR